MPEPILEKRVRCGGIDRAQLLHALSRAGVQLNAHAHALLGDARFTTSAEPWTAHVVAFTVAELGFPAGAVMAELHARAQSRGLAWCPLEVAVHLRLQHLEQAEGHVGQPVTVHRAPPGSLTVASAPLDDDEDTPRGFYLRTIQGVPWLRGFCCGEDHAWSPADVLVFMVRRD